MKAFLCCAVAFCSLITASECLAEDEGTSKVVFSGCGTIVQGVECPFLATGSGALFLLDDYGDFGLGDAVFVEGVVESDCASDCQQGDACITTSLVEACDDGSDLDADGDVDFNDLLILLSEWGPCLILGPLGCAADLDGDNVVGFGDLLILLANWAN